MSDMPFDHQKLSNRILASMALGLIVGIGLNMTLASNDWFNAVVLEGLLTAVGEIFVRFLSMLVVPLVFVSLITGVSALSDPKKLGRVGGKALSLYLFTTGVAVTLALVSAIVIQPGVGASPDVLVERDIAAQPSFFQVLVDMVPQNPVRAMAEGDMLPIIVFAVLVGLSVALAGDAGKRISFLPCWSASRWPWRAMPANESGSFSAISTRW